MTTLLAEKHRLPIEDAQPKLLGTSIRPKTRRYVFTEKPKHQSETSRDVPSARRSTLVSGDY
jgi:hypothetical protein